MLRRRRPTVASADKKNGMEPKLHPVLKWSPPDVGAVVPSYTLL